MTKKKNSARLRRNKRKKINHGEIRNKQDRIMNGYYSVYPTRIFYSHDDDDDDE